MTRAAGLLHLTGDAVMKRRLADLPSKAKAECALAFERIGTTVVAEARRSLAAISPSRPGDPPADPAVAISESLNWSVDAAAGRLTVTASVPYASFLEYGTMRMAARPFLRPAAAGASDTARAELLDALSRAAREPGGNS